MATSRNSGHSRKTPLRSFRDGLPDLSRYDLLLAVIPLVFATVLAVHATFGVSFRVAVGGGALLSSVAVSDALFFNPPTTPDRSE
jgi:hypothetical protein